MLVLDRDHFNHMTGADRALQTEVLSLFRMQVSDWINALDAEVDWREAVHTMKGSARGIGLMVLADACEAAENAPTSECALALSRIRSDLETALAALEQFAAEAV